MKKKILSMALSCSMLLNVFTSPLSVKADTKTTGKTYYVSTIDGSDRNDGLSEDKAFYSLQKINEIELEPGDKVLLEADSVFTNGFLHIKGSGSEEAPIIIDKYGEGNNPRIDTNGQGIWYQDYGKKLDNPSHKNKGYVSSSILLYDVEYINIKNLEITNKAPEIEAKYNSLNTMNRTGVAAVAQNKGTIDHIYLDGLNIHDVIGNVYDKHMNNGGIYFTVFQPKNEAETGISRYNDIKIENSIVNNVNRWGIAVGYTAYSDKFLASEISDDVIAKYGSTNVEIRNNYIKDAGGDAITTMYCDRPLIEYNVSDGVAKQINTTDYSETGFGRVAAGIWPWKCKDAVFQYNEAFDTSLNQDGQAWDADSGDGTIYQYNYSHNNGGGAVMVCLDQAVNTVFRYNISENDLSGVLNLPGHPKAEIYNNTFYIKEGVPFIRPGMTGGVAVIENNIIYNAGAAKSEDWTRSNTRVTYSNNLYYNYTNLPTDDKAAVTADPKFVNGGSGPKAYTGITPVAGTNITHDLSAFDGYKLQDDSPAINAGKSIANNGGRDFFGNKIVGATDIGAYESKIVSASKDNSIKSSAYMVKESEKNLYVPSLEKNQTKVEEIINGLEVDSTATIKVFDGDKEVKVGNVKEGMTLKVIAENGAENNYTIKIKNSYQWSLDYTGTQGNVWFGQKKLNGEYINLTSYDATYPQWNGVSYGGVGIDAPNHSTIPTDETHGLLVDSMGQSREQGHSMAYRAPKSGTIVLSVKDNEPYLRQDGNSGGKVKLSFTHNGEEISSYELKDSKVKAEVKPMTIEVNKGDFIRVEAQNIDNPTKPSIHVTPKIEYQDVLEEDTQAPTVPTEVKTSNITENSVDISWTASTDNVAVVGYEIYNGDTLLLTVTEGTTAKITGLEAGKEYTLKIKALDGAGNKSEASTVTFKTTESSVEPEEVEKTLLGLIIEYAKDVKENGALEDVVPAVVKEFELALKEAEEVFENKKATEVQVELASKRLINVIQMLEFKKGDKTELIKLVGLVNGLQEDNYTTSTWTKLQDELEKANKVIADENAMEKEVIESYEKLMDAMNNLELSSDKSKLQKLVNELEGKDLSGYIQVTVSKFNSELENAKVVLADNEATQEQINEAYNKLIKAYLDLRLIPDKSKLEELLSKSQTIDLSKYTKESVENFNLNLAKVKDVLANEEATQEEVDKVAAALELAMDDLKEIAQASDTDNNSGNNNTATNSTNNNESSNSRRNSSSNLPNTGGTSSVAIGLFATVTTLAGVVVMNRKKKN